MWKVKDWFINAGLTIRLWFYVTFNKKRFKGVNNSQEKKGWEMSFNDEFNKGKLDRKKWITKAYYGYRFHPGSIIDNGTAPDIYLGDNMFEFEGSVMKQKATNNPITVNYTDKGEYFLFKISDNGVGIKPELQNKIFGLFSIQSE